MKRFTSFLLRVVVQGLETQKTACRQTEGRPQDLLGRVHPGRVGILDCELSIVPSLIGSAGSEL